MNDNLVRYEKIITSLLFKFDKPLIIKMYAAGYKEDIRQDVILSAYEAYAESPEFSFEVAQQKRNEIQHKLRYQYGRSKYFCKEKYFNASRSAPGALDTIETLYLCGGAKAVRKYLGDTGETSPRQIDKLLSKCFGCRTDDGENRNPNQFRYHPIRKRFKKLESQGYEIRTTRYGSVYAVNGSHRIRFSNHDIDNMFSWMYTDIQESHNVQTIFS